MEITAIVALSALGFTILGALIRLIWNMASLHTKVDEIMTNHFPHLEDRMERIENWFDHRE